MEGIDLGQISKQRLYFVRYSDGEAGRLTREKMTQCFAAAADPADLTVQTGHSPADNEGYGE